MIPQTLLQAVELEKGANPQATVLGLHGVGADGHQLEPIIDRIVRPDDCAVRFVFPHAPLRAVTLCGGERMRAWYDLRSKDRQERQDEAAIRESAAAVRALIEREMARGVPSERIVLAGFSQGGAMALVTGTRLPLPLAGLVALSCYPLLAESFEAERQAANQRASIFLAHGLSDPVIDVRIGEHMRDQLRSSGYSVEWHSYPIGHELSPEELEAVARFVRRALSLAP